MIELIDNYNTIKCNYTKLNYTAIDFIIRIVTSK